MRGVKTNRTASIVIRGRAFVHNLRRGHYELGVEVLRVSGLRPHSMNSCPRSKCQSHPRTLPHALYLDNATEPSGRSGSVALHTSIRLGHARAMKGSSVHELR
jgi:hypothetical protein